MRRFAGLLALVMLAAALPARASDPPRLSQERVILHTIAGDLVLVLYPDVAPKTVEQFLKLVRAGVYDTTAFVRIEPGFVAQLSDAVTDRTVPLTAAQKALVHDLPDEFNALKHVRGTLSMAHWDRPNSGQTSFSILLGSAPHLDGKYTIFGRLESGYQVLDEMLKVPRDGNKPTVRLQVTKAEVAPSEELFAKMKLAPAKPIPFVAPAAAPPVAAPAAAPMVAATADSTADDSPRVPVAGGILLIILVGLASFFLQGRVPPPVHQSLNLVMVLIGAFLFLVVAAPIGQHHGLLAIALFLGLLGVLKVLGKFEMAVEKKK